MASASVATIARESELRFEVAADDSAATVTLVSGDAEIFGAPLVAECPVQLLAGASYAVFSWGGASVELEGPARCIELHLHRHDHV